MKKILLLSSLFLLNGCIFDELQKKDGKFLADVVNLEEFNSAFDDYNSDLPYNKSGQTHLVFSSKRYNKDFLNLVYFNAEFTYDKRLGLRKFSGNGAIKYDFAEYGALSSLASRANGNFNVYGPKSLSFSQDLISYGDGAKDLLLFYADDSEGDMEIKYIRSNKDGITGPEKFSLLNSPQDDGYPSFSHYGDKVYFSSNRDGNFDIYELSIPRKESERITVESLVSPKDYQLRKIEELSGIHEDKCPYFYNNTLVFVSDRPGGQGGFDIYYSKLEAGKWSKPVNAGSRINTPHNEYRPILPSLSHFSYPLMLFSSDRPGGKGGYDLYMTGLKEDF
jgi:Tol biopolymer transport system component